MRPKIEFFIDREMELRKLRTLVKSKNKILLVGLRGYGKTSLLVKFLDILEKEEKEIGIYVNCLRIYSGADLLLEVKNDIEKLDIIKYYKNSYALQQEDKLFADFLYRLMKKSPPDKITKIKRFNL